MYAKNCTIEELEQALNNVNKLYDNNVIFNHFPEYRGKRIIFTLRVINSNKKGAKRTISGRRHTSACWHVHGDFFDLLFEINNQAEIIAVNKKINIDGGNWQDRNIGSTLNPLYYSQACECNILIT